MDAHLILNVPEKGMLERFAEEAKRRGFVPDAAQSAAAERLQHFYEELLEFKAQRRTALHRFLMHPVLPRGVWFWGGVGRGKSFMMNCFFDAVPYRKKRRVHFHAFMQEVHAALNHKRSEGNHADPLAEIAKEIAEQTRLMCFDEFHVSDIADAMILGRLMQALFDEGVVFCITSNYPPSGLYPDGLHRDQFLPVIELLENKLDVIELDAGIDYRSRTLAQADNYFIDADEGIWFQMQQAFMKRVGGPGVDESIYLGGRELIIVRRAGGVLWCTFQALCGEAHGQSDYLEIARNFHTLFLTGVPRMTADRASEARRFTWLVDILYDANVQLVIAADCAAEELYVDGVHADEFHRTVSRLREMQSLEYREQAHRPPTGPKAFL
ncbi:MAG TPA: cell division protein ZapE [Rhodocyclaceae bacterium]|nr:cell division protein ZapE [Rhodocyclaceae bacterium]